MSKKWKPAVEYSAPKTPAWMKPMDKSTPSKPSDQDIKGIILSYSDAMITLFTMAHKLNKRSARAMEAYEEGDATEFTRATVTLIIKAMTDLSRIMHEHEDFTRSLVKVALDKDDRDAFYQMTEQTNDYMERIIEAMQGQGWLNAEEMTKEGALAGTIDLEKVQPLKPKAKRKRKEQADAE